MNDPAQFELSETLLAVCLLVFSASVALWVWIVRRAIHGKPIMPYAWRRPVPWQAVDLLVVAAFYYLIPSAIFDLDRRLFPVPLTPAADKVDEVAASTEHPVLVLLRQDRTPSTLVVCLVAVVLVAPIAEEILFRLLLQGALEGAERRWRRLARGAGLLLRGPMPLIGSSLAFALLHARGAAPPPDARLVFHILVCGMLGNTVTVVLALALVRVRAGASAVDLGWQRDKLADDLKLGLGTALSVVPWLYVVQVSMTALLPKSISADPITLIPFAFVLGLLYYRTHRIVPSILLHMALNATSLALAWSVLPKGL